MESLRTKSLLAIILLCCTVLTAPVVANPISWQQAQQNAQTFLQQRGKHVDIPSLRRAPMTSSAPCYIFNIGDNEGYVIAAADDCVSPILGYSYEGSIDVEHIPDNMQWWIDEYACQIQFMREKGRSTPRAPKKSPAQPAVAPLLTTHWNQTRPYNQACPLDTNGERCMTGCVATAMAQVLYYHHARSVTQTTHEMAAYVTKRGVSVSAIPAGSFIDWDNMAERYGLSVETTPEQDAAVANLMRYCGSSVHMNYTSGSSGAAAAHVAPAMIAYFNYTSKTQAVNRSDCGLSDDEWEDMIYNELSNSRPVLYSGFTEYNVGHAFVCDGYDGEGFYHINMGWGDQGTYYLLTAIDSVGTSLIHFNRSQEVIINAEPRDIMPSLDEGIQFADPITRALCLNAADTDDDGTVTIEEAAAVTDMGPYRWLWMSSFDEFKYFTGVTSLGFAIFNGCEELQSFVLHDAVTSIGENAFNNCSSLKEISIPASVTSVGNNAFLGCSSMKKFHWNAKSCLPAVGGIIPAAVEWLSIGDSVEVIPSSFAKNTKIKRLTLGKNVTKIASYAFYRCARLERVVIPESVQSIAQWAFFEDTALEEVTLGNGLIEIGDRAFDWCSSLKSITIPNSVTKIGMYAFYKCTEMSSVVIGSSVASINGNAFNGCDSLKTVTCLILEPITINANVFNNLYNQAVLRVPADALEAYQEAYPWNRFSQIIPIDPADGDVNLDGMTGADDVTTLIDQILNGSTNYFGDVNCDGIVNIEDATTLIDRLLAGQ